MFWPSFNSGPVGDNPELQRQAIVNTYFALAACVVTSFVASAAVEKKFRLNMVNYIVRNRDTGPLVYRFTCKGTSYDVLVIPPTQPSSRTSLLS